MGNQRVFITGVGGQDGSYLCEHLLSLGHKIYGMVRRNSVSENQTARLNGIRDKIHIEYGDLTDMSSIISLLKLSNPDWVFHLGAMSHVQVSFKEPIYTSQANALGTLNVLEAIRLTCPSAKLYFAGSSEQFGNESTNGYQNEFTKMTPVSPYGASKVFAYNMVRNYRASYGMFASSGILMNHESPRRPRNFVTTKVVRGALDIKAGKTDTLVLGNLEACRDWGHASDYTKAMIQIIDHKTPDDFVISTGKSHSVRYLCEYVFYKLGMNYRNHVVSDPKYMRPEELHYLKGDSTKARNILGWEPTYTLETMLDEMILAFSNQ